jgi:hypothetical protein
MKPLEPDEHEQWEDLVRRLGGTPEQAQTSPAIGSSDDGQESQPAEAPQGPRDYELAEETVEDFQPPEPKPIASGNPRTVLSWFGVIGAAVIWIIAGLLSWPLPWWLSTVTVVAFLGGAVSLFFLLPKSWAHRDPFDNDDYGDGAKL